MSIYELLNMIITNKRFELSSQLFIDEDKERIDEADVPIFDLLKNIASLGRRTHNSGIEFHPMWELADGRRSFSIEDITDDDYEILKSLDFQKLPLTLRALVADILWTEKKDFSISQIASEAYWELFQLWYNEGDNIGTLDMIRRAVNISVQTKQQPLYSKICSWLNGFLSHGDVNGDVFFTLRIMELFAEIKDYDVSLFLPTLDSIISSNYDNIAKTEQAYELKTQCLYKLKKNQDATSNNLSLAKYYVEFAEKTLEKDIQSNMRAVSIFQKAIMLYRNNGEPQQAEKVHKRLVEVQKEIPRNMVPLSVELDLKGAIDCIKVNMEGLTFEESILRFTRMISFERQEEIKSRVITEQREHPLSHLWQTNIINSQGQTVFVLPPLDIQNPEKDQKLLELHMHQNALEKQKMVGDIWVANILAIIREKFPFDDSMTEFLVKDNPIIPKGRERIFQSAINMFLRGEYFEAMHILAPQTENLFRNIAKDVGGLTVTLGNDGSSMEKVLGSIFNLQELLDCYDNDILFTFKGLLSEQAGANIRNEIAHGIIEEAACSSGACLYFGAAVIKLLTHTSVPCFQILKSSEKLKKFVMPSKDAIKIIQKDKTQ